MLLACHSLSFPDPRPAGRLIVRSADSTDHDAIREVVRAAYQQYEPVTGSELFSHYISDLLDFERHSRDGRLIVAELDGGVRGSGAFYPDVSAQGVGWPRGWAGGRALAVHPAARGHGVAQALLAAAECLARHHGAPVFALHTASFMTTAVALYDRLGYRRAPNSIVTLEPSWAWKARQRSARSLTSATSGRTGRQ